MGVTLLGAFRQVFGRPVRCLLLCLFVMVASAAFSQKPATRDKSAPIPPNVETSEDTNDRIVELAQAASARQNDYVIGSGDLLEVQVFDVTELSREIRVDESGLIALPLVPVRVRAAGLTPFQLQDKIAEVLQANGLVTNPNVTIAVKERHSEPITVTGAVRTPTVIQAVRQMTLLEVISAAGGIAPDAGTEIMISRRSREADPNDKLPSQGEPPASIFKIDLNELLYSGDLRFNVPVIGGDVVTVPRAGVVYAVGAVKSPGGFVMEGDRQHMTVLKIVSLSGGWLPSAKPGQAFILRQNPDTGERIHVPVDVKKILTLKTEDVTLRQNDILYVPDSTSNRALRRTGEIAIGLATGVALYRVTAGVP